MSESGEGAAWCIFDSKSESNEVIQCSSKEYAMETHDNDLINECRQFSKNYFTKEGSFVCNYSVKLDKRFESPLSDFDLLLKVVEKTVLEDKIVYFVMDETDSCELHTYRYFNYVNKGDVIRLRSFKLYQEY